MAEDLLDYWVRLIKTIFPANAWINSRYSNNDYLIQIDWKLQNDSENTTKRSNKIEIIIKEGVINNYLDKNKIDRDLSDIILKEFFCERYNHSISDNDIDTNQHVSTKTWLISKDVINHKTPFEHPLGNQVGPVHP
jgi:hypothetical protein